MSKATVTTAFKGVRDGEHRPTSFAPGDAIEGDLADAMVNAGYAKRDGARKAPEKRARGGAPKNKSK